MALGFGANARLIAAYEATYGTPLSDGYHRLGFSRYGLSARQQLIDNDLLGEGRDPAPAVLGALTCDGEVVVPCDARQIGFWLKALLGAPTTTVTTNFTILFSRAAPQSQACLSRRSTRIFHFVGPILARASTVSPCRCAATA